MKIKCDKCGKDITVLCDSNIENYQVGKTKCPNCNALQKRYISEADILLFFGINELVYTIFTYLGVMIFDIGLKIWSFLILFLVFVIYYFISKYIASYIYINAPFKKDAKYKVFEEDSIQIKKSYTWQFILFFTIAITGLTLDSDVRKYFLFVLPLIALIAFAKFYFQIKYENKK